MIGTGFVALASAGTNGAEREASKSMGPHFRRRLATADLQMAGRSPAELRPAVTCSGAEVKPARPDCRVRAAVRVVAPVPCTCGRAWRYWNDAGCDPRFEHNLSRYIRRIETGERIAVTAHSRVVAELVPPSTQAKGGRRSRYEELIAAGMIRPALEGGDPLAGWPDIQLPPGTAATWIDSDRDEA